MARYVQTNNQKIALQLVRSLALDDIYHGINPPKAYRNRSLFPTWCLAPSKLKKKNIKTPIKGLGEGNSIKSRPVLIQTLIKVSGSSKISKLSPSALSRFYSKESTLPSAYRLLDVPVECSLACGNLPGCRLHHCCRHHSRSETAASSFWSE